MCCYYTASKTPDPEGPDATVTCPKCGASYFQMQESGYGSCQDCGFVQRVVEPTKHPPPGEAGGKD